MQLKLGNGFLVLVGFAAIDGALVGAVVDFIDATDQGNVHGWFLFCWPQWAMMWERRERAAPRAWCPQDDRELAEVMLYGMGCTARVVDASRKRGAGCSEAVDADSRNATAGAHEPVAHGRDLPGVPA